MKKSRIARPVPQAESPLRQLPLVDLLVDTEAELFELVMRSGLAGVRPRCSRRTARRSVARGIAHEPDRPASRAGTVPERSRAGRPEGRHSAAAGADRGGEVPLPTFQTMAGDRSAESAGRRADAGRRGHAAVRAEPGAARRPDVASRGHEQERVSRRFVARTTRAIDSVAGAAVGRPARWRCLLIDGVHVGEHCLIVALGITEDGHETRAGPVGRLDGERDRVPEPAGESAESRAPHRSQPAGDPRWLEGPAQGGPRRCSARRR